MAHHLLEDEGLDRFYELRRGPGVPVGSVPDASRAWLEPLLDQARAIAGAGEPLHLTIDVQGIHCAACVWLIETLFRRRPGAVHIAVDPGVGRLELYFAGETFPLTEYLADLASVGYRTGPARKGAAVEAGGADELLIRLGVTAAIALNSMMLSLAHYFGLSATTDGDIFRVFAWVNLGLGTAAVLVGGPVFFRGALAGLRMGMLHLDVPIALGIALAWGGSAWLFFSGRLESTYFDTLTVFIALMLVGRWLQRRAVARNRRLLLTDPGVDGLRVRRIEPVSGRLDVVPVAELRPGDGLVLAPGELLPVDAVLVGGEGAPDAAELSLAWITGEPAPITFRRGQPIPAGAHHAGQSPLRVEATADFAGSDLRRLLTPAGEAGPEPAMARFWDLLARAWVVAVLLLAAAGATIWQALDGPVAALQVAVAVLVVTCPCAIGLATPLAYEIAQARLRRLGLFIRRDGALDRLAAVRRVLFDKTGTLTMGTLSLARPADLDALSPEARAALYLMVAGSNHPKSRTIHEALDRRYGANLSWDAAATLVEHPGVGLELRRGDGVSWTLEAAPETDGAVLLARDGEPAAPPLAFAEALHHDARREVAELRARGYDVQLVSGDAPVRVRAAARDLGLSAEAAHGGLDPDAKAAFVARLDRSDTLYVGDGINDGPALDAAFCAGTPAVDRPSLPARADFYLLGGGVGPIGAALELADLVRRTVRHNLIFAAAYNAAGAGLALAGLLSPLLCAVLMPLSSLAIVAGTVAAFGRRGLPRATAGRASARSITTSAALTSEPVR